MLKKLPKQPQLEMFRTVLVSFINPEHELCQLARKIDWPARSPTVNPFFSNNDRFAIQGPALLMAQIPDLLASRASS
jgi:hypothetical protein